MLSTVVLPKTCGGLRISTEGRRAVFDPSITMDAWIPGVMMPPRYSLSFVTAQRVVAVTQTPMIRLGPGKWLNAPKTLGSLWDPPYNAFRVAIFEPILASRGCRNGF